MYGQGRFLLGAYISNGVNRGGGGYKNFVAHGRRCKIAVWNAYSSLWNTGFIMNVLPALFCFRNQNILREF